jgi:glycine betaine/proline transport system substrate-binding protein
MRNLLASVRIKGLIALATTALLVLGACGGDSADTEVKETIVFSGLNWDSAQVQNAVARYIIENGYGYPTDHIEGATVPLFQGLIKGEIDVTMEIWLPNQQAVWDEAIKQGQVISVGKSLEDNWQSSWIIPAYTAAANPGLVKVSDIPDYVDLFTQPDSGGKAVLIGCIAQWACRGVEEDQIVAYGLEDVVELRDPGDMGGLNAAITGAYKKEQDLLFYYWGPTKIANELDMVLLEEPPSGDCALPNDGCAFPAAEILIAVTPAMADKAPDVIKFFRNWEWDADNQLAAEGWLADNKDKHDDYYNQTAIWYLSNNDAWQAWVPTEIAEKVVESLG